MINIIGWVPLIVFWTLNFSDFDATWMIALPAFSIGVFLSAIINK